MKKIAIAGLIFLQIFIYGFTCLSSDLSDYVTYMNTTDKEFIVAWTDIGPEYIYKLQLFNIERNESKIIGTTSEGQYTFKLPRSGHYIVKICSCTPKSDGSGELVCSEWSESIDPTVARVNEKPRAWWVYGYVAPPSGAVIQ